MLQKEKKEFHLKQASQSLVQSVDSGLTDVWHEKVKLETKRL